MTPTPYRAGFVSIAGRPNAGKSTLLNALVGEKLAITAHQPQTTRTSIQGVLTTPESQIVFVDTPGIHKSDTLFNRRMMNTVRAALKDRDLILYVADASKSVGDEDERAAATLNQSAKALLVLNKIDRLNDKRLLLPLIENYLRIFPFAGALPVSARKGDGLDELKRVVNQNLPEAPAFFPNDYLTDQPMRFLAAETIREQVLRVTSEEVPHAVAILIENWEEKPRLTRIAAAIQVERPGQKAILIGSQGQMLKKIGTGARLELERMLRHKVFLSLFVKVKPKWRDDPSFLDTADWR